MGCSIFEADIPPQYCVRNHTIYITDFTIITASKDTIKSDSVFIGKTDNFVAISKGTVEVTAILRGYSEVLTESFVAKKESKIYCFDKHYVWSPRHAYLG